MQKIAKYLIRGPVTGSRPGRATEVAVPDVHQAISASRHDQVSSHVEGQYRSDVLREEDAEYVRCFPYVHAVLLFFRVCEWKGVFRARM